MGIISQPQLSSQRNPGYLKITNSLGGSNLFHAQLAKSDGISVLFVRIPCRKNEQKDETAKKIIIGHKYHNSISKFNYSRS